MGLAAFNRMRRRQAQQNLQVEEAPVAVTQEEAPKKPRTRKVKEGEANANADK